MKSTLDDHKMKMTAKTLNIKMIYKIKTVTKMNTEEMKITPKKKMTPKNGDHLYLTNFAAHSHI